MTWSGLGNARPLIMLLRLYVVITWMMKYYLCSKQPAQESHYYIASLAGHGAEMDSGYCRCAIQ
jgi:hypothetical protein